MSVRIRIPNPDRRGRRNPSKAAWFAIGTLVGIGVAAKIGIIYIYRKMQKM